ncbi:MAG TPA: hypothetical protein DDZ80_28700 [Cyanobacteria bacterium UBA8803]|nr:hypothetical protein [Cyanobacteria bacterium UBA9273]HBL62236.1 hypothetical protein [Cyanobacteria bacterium UBA8803]
MSLNRKLDALSVAALLVSVHYGLGFLLGTGEQAFTLGVAGSLYAVSTSLGLLAILVLVKFYWKEVEPIWTLLGDCYGGFVKIVVGFLSWAWMIGVVASQILGGAFIVKILGLPLLPSMVTLTMAIALLSLVPVEQVSKLFQGLLVLSSLALLYSLWAVKGVPNYFHSLLEFVPALTQVNPPQLAGIPLTTIALTAIGMDFQQFIVQAKDMRSAYQGCLLAALILLLLAFLPSSVVVAAQDSGILPASIEAKQAIPYILLWIGGGAAQPVGILLIASLLVTALGSGGGVLRVMNQTLFDLNLLAPSRRNQILLTVFNTFLVLAIALTGTSIIELIVSFYAIYVAGVLVPFLGYLLDQKGGYHFSASTISLSLVCGSLSAVAVLVATHILPATSLLGDAALSILAIGIVFSSIGLLIGKVLERIEVFSEVATDRLPTDS